MKKQQSSKKSVSTSSSTSTSSKKKTSKLNSSRENANHNKDFYYPERSAAPKQYKMTGHQTRTWKPLDKDFKTQLHLMIDGCIKMVMSKPVFRKNEDVQELSSDLKRKLKASLEKVKVPKSRLKSLQKLAVTAADLKTEYENLTNQQLEVEREIRQEERLIESLEDGVEKEILVLEVPDDVLGLPKMVFGPS